MTMIAISMLSVAFMMLNAPLAEGDLMDDFYINFDCVARHEGDCCYVWSEEYFPGYCASYYEEFYETGDGRCSIFLYDFAWPNFNGEWIPTDYINGFVSYKRDWYGLAWYVWRDEAWGHPGWALGTSTNGDPDALFGETLDHSKFTHWGWKWGETLFFDGGWWYKDIDGSWKEDADARMRCNYEEDYDYSSAMAPMFAAMDNRSDQNDHGDDRMSTISPFESTLKDETVPPAVMEVGDYAPPLPADMSIFMSADDNADGDASPFRAMDAKSRGIAALLLLLNVVLCSVICVYRGRNKRVYSKVGVESETDVEIENGVEGLGFVDQNE